MSQAIDNAVQAMYVGELKEYRFRAHLEWLSTNRQNARKARNFVLADEYRNQLILCGVDVLELDKELHGPVRNEV